MTDLKGLFSRLKELYNELIQTEHSISGVISSIMTELNYTANGYEIKIYESTFDIIIKSGIINNYDLDMLKKWFSMHGYELEYISTRSGKGRRNLRENKRVVESYYDENVLILTFIQMDKEEKRNEGK